MSYSLTEDCARALATVLMDICGHCFREEEQRDLYEEFYQSVKAGLESYQSLKVSVLFEPSEN